MNTFSFFRCLTRYTDFRKQDITDAMMFWSRAFIELNSSFLSIFYLFPFSTRLQIILISKQNSVIETRSVFSTCVLNICSAIERAFFFHWLTSSLLISGLLTSIKNTYYLFPLGLYWLIYLKLLSSYFLIWCIYNIFWIVVFVLECIIGLNWLPSRQSRHKLNASK